MKKYLNLLLILIQTIRIKSQKVINVGPYLLTKTELTNCQFETQQVESNAKQFTKSDYLQMLNTNKDFKDLKLPQQNVFTFTSQNSDVIEFDSDDLNSVEFCGRRQTSDYQLLNLSNGSVSVDFQYSIYLDEGSTDVWLNNRNDLAVVLEGTMKSVVEEILSVELGVSSNSSRSIIADKQQRNLRSSSSAHLNRYRELQVDYTSNDIVSLEPITGNEKCKRCFNVDALIKMKLDEENEQAAHDAVLYQLTLSLQNGLFEKYLPSNISIVEPSFVPPTPSPSGGDPDPQGQNIGVYVIIGAAAILISGGGYLITKKRNQSKQIKDDQPLGVVPINTQPEYIPEDESHSAGSSGWSSSAGQNSLISADNVSYGNSLAQIGVASGAVSRLDTKLPPKPSVMDIKNTSSLGEEEEEMSETSSQLIDDVVLENVPDMPPVSKNDLDDAIDKGDWAAVGATAALLATTATSLDSDVGSQYSSRSGKVSKSSSRSSLSSVDRLRAAELDQLVDTGDWEGVVLTAQKYDNDEYHNSPRMDFPSSNDSFTPSLNTFVSPSTATSESPSRTAVDHAQFRADVEDLVRKVVPDELENVDEMIIQFQGREDELLETLRTMQERAIASRARAAVHKTAKREALQNVQTPPQKTSLNIDELNAAVAAKSSKNMNTNDDTADTVFSEPKFDGEIASKESSRISGVRRLVGGTIPTPQTNTTSSSSSAGSLQKHKKKSAGDPDAAGYYGDGEPSSVRPSLEKMISEGDWEAVSKAASQINAKNTSSMSSSANKLRAAAAPFSDSQRSTNINDLRDNTEDSEFLNYRRGVELEKMMNEGDWGGVALAANQFSTSDRALGKTKEESSSKATGDSVVSGSTDSKSGMGRKLDDTALQREEQDALAEAEAWMAIAEKNKPEGASKGASAAADWAISRSLSALHSAENDSTRDDGKRTQSAEDSSV